MVNGRAAIVLAAGAGSRFGANKLVTEVAGRPLVRLSVELVLRSTVCDVIVVIGHETARLREALHEMPVRFVENVAYASGLGGSVAVGAGALNADSSAAVVVLGDQPVEPELIDALFDAQLSSGLPVAVPVYRGARRHPVVFGATMFEELSTLSGHAGARILVDADPSRVVRLDLDRPVPADLDVPGDLGDLTRSLGERGLT
jgi:molybdenum cofactor cytidylyltransferase